MSAALARASAWLAGSGAAKDGAAARLLDGARGAQGPPAGAAGGPAPRRALRLFVLTALVALGLLRLRDARLVDGNDLKGDVAADPALSSDQLAVLRAETERLAEQALAQLSAAASANSSAWCRPRICRRRVALRPANASHTAVLLASVPGSGNTVLRSLIRYGTRFYTGSVYKDRALFADGFLGELENPSRGRSFVVKTHYPFLEQRKDPNSRFPAWASGAVHLLRSPFDAALADCKRAHSGSHTAQLRPQRVINLCGNRTEKSLPRWERMLSFWEGAGAVGAGSAGGVERDGSERESYGQHELERDGTVEYGAADLGERDGAAGFVGPLKLRLLPLTSRGATAFPVASLWYEDLMRDTVRSLAYLFAFLKVVMPDEPDFVPSVADAVLCVSHDRRALERVHRSSSRYETPNVFRNASGVSRLGRRLCARYAPYWNTHKWGTCDGLLQNRSALQLLPALDRDCP